MKVMNENSVRRVIMTNYQKTYCTVKIWVLRVHTCTHDPVDPCFIHTALYITQVLNVPIGKHRDAHCLPAIDRERYRF